MWGQVRVCQPNWCPTTSLRHWLQTAVPIKADRKKLIPKLLQPVNHQAKTGAFSAPDYCRHSAKPVGLPNRQNGLFMYIQMTRFPSGRASRGSVGSRTEIIWDCRANVEFASVSRPRLMQGSPLVYGASFFCFEPGCLDSTPAKVEARLLSMLADKDI